MNDVDVLIQHSLARLAVLLLIIGASVRGVLFISAVVMRGVRKSALPGWAPAALIRFFLPLHSAAGKKTAYVISRYIFHLCLVIVPLGFSRHFYLFEENGYTVFWYALPDEWIDGLTLLVFFFVLYFSARRIFFRENRTGSTVSDAAVIIITALPFLTGYALTHGSLDFIPFLSRNLLTIHALSAEAMMIMAVLLFLGVRMKPESCIGCASCVLYCPTEALTVQDDGTKRRFTYAPFQCIRCGSCVKTCPENAVELKHVISAARYLQIFKNQSILSLDLTPCERCGKSFAPKAQLDKLLQLVPKAVPDFCSRCKQREAARTLDGGYLRNCRPQPSLLTVEDISATCVSRNKSR